MPTLYKDTGYTVIHLIEEIKHGTIALPDIQRPFVWPATRVRDLFDSMYRGFPVGTLMLWDASDEVGTRQIGYNDSKKPGKLIVDGQQRVTSLYAVITGNEIVTKDFKKKPIRIAFRPSDKTFEVTNPAIKRNPEFIPDITVLWVKHYKSMLRKFFDRLKQNRSSGLSIEERDDLEDHIDRVRDLRDFRFQVIELEKHADTAKVAEIFVRINSQGVNLKQADFILTLMSVHWEKGRRELERFCREAVDPSVSGSSPKNVLISPTPDQLLRAAVGLAFRRGQLRHVYSILRGKDLKTAVVNTEQRVEQFDMLKRALDKVLNLNNWHEYLKCLIVAGFRGRYMVTSKNTIIFTYILWLIGRCDFGLGHHTLQRVIGRWFFMAQTTGRYTSSPESRIESDLGRISDLETSDGAAFTKELDRIVDTNLTQDYWEINLPNQLDKSASKSPALCAYWAALNLLNASLLFSNLRIKDFLDSTFLDSARGAPRAIERHHLFPKKFLASMGVNETKRVNNVANMTLVDWPENVEINTQNPKEYWPKMSRRLNTQALREQMHWHALPRDWPQMDYATFLEKRRQLIAAIVREGFKRLSDRELPPNKPISIEEIIALGESQELEFKSSGRWNFHTNSRDKVMEYVLVKTVCGFLNAEGGMLLIGVSDGGEVLGLTKDYATLGRSPNRDRYELWLRQYLDNSLSSQTAGIVRIDFTQICGHEVCTVRVGKAHKPIFAKPRSGSSNASDFWVRVGNAIKQFEGPDMLDYQERHWG